MGMEQAKSFFEQGREYYNQGRYKDAIPYLEAAVRAGYPQLDYMISQAKEKAAQQDGQTGVPVKPAESPHHRIRTHPTPAEAQEGERWRAKEYYDKGNELYEQGRYADALVYYGQAEKEGLSLPEYKRILIQQKIKEKKTTNAEQPIRSAEVTKSAKPVSHKQVKQTNHFSVKGLWEHVKGSLWKLCLPACFLVPAIFLSSVLQYGVLLYLGLVVVLGVCLLFFVSFIKDLPNMFREAKRYENLPSDEKVRIQRRQEKILFAIQHGMSYTVSNNGNVLVRCPCCGTHSDCYEWKQLSEYTSTTDHYIGGFYEGGTVASSSMFECPKCGYHINTLTTGQY